MSARLLTTADADAWNAALPPERSAFGSLGFARAQERAGLGEQPPAGRRARSRSLPAPPAPARGTLPFPTDRERRALGLLVAAVHRPAGRRRAGDARWRSRSPRCSRTRASSPSSPTCIRGRRDPELVGGGEPDREIVWVDLALDAERLWRESYSKACRKNVNRAEREGVTVRAAAGRGRHRRVPPHLHPDDGAQPRRSSTTSSTAPTSRRSSRRCRTAPASPWPSTTGRGDRGDALPARRATTSTRTSAAPTTRTSSCARPTRSSTTRSAGRGRQGKRRLILGGGYRPGRRDLPLQGELLAAAGDARARAPRPPPRRLRGAGRGVARPPRRPRRGHRRSRSTARLL